MPDLSGRVDSKIDFTAIAGVVSGFAAAITAWQSESGANRKINRYTNAVVALKNRACMLLLYASYIKCARFVHSAVISHDAATWPRHD